ncbi:hypothetical protein [Deminuibacter soli]|nr:hypothetical protein [Deminuibacter soli]
MYQSIPHAHLYVVPGGGHIPYIGPGRREAFLKQALAFLQGDF